MSDSTADGEGAVGSQARDTTLRCPNCGMDATARIRAEGTGRVHVLGYDCPSGCVVDEEAIRQIVGTSDN